MSKTYRTGPASGTPADPMLPLGTGRSTCCACGRYFGGTSGFAAHQKDRRDGTIECRDPATLGMVLKGGYWIKELEGGFGSPTMAVPASPLHESRNEGADEASGAIVTQTALL